ncbi:sigma-70 family RNA polymerase sigma factor [Reichenbachiella agarivorans]|uniref:Sigma-70 family RNA polymerase sigma factor n=1 Tax=Reichenbachiella agarivorans TaxID=2979464 RepID=A0ABY6CVE6_9BACT|nr:sigma-70 family RNA polymerase sigma factor [Reichenbachiella agarivorans]UXP33899.1 sigma-70 family RNA polymerase sigma factor [Reichenbachiella agarivorans]
MKSDFQFFLNEHHRIIAKVCRIYTDTAEDFNDYYQECVIQLWRSFDTFRGASKLSTWVYRVCLNVCLSQLRSKKKNLTVARENLPDTIDDNDGIEEEQLTMLYTAIKALKESDRAIILLYLEERSYKEMADILGITVTNVGAKVNRVKIQLKKIIDGRTGY